ncbi:hypothetical protein Tco_0814354 [Tanacetum coccineum]
MWSPDRLLMDFLEILLLSEICCEFSSGRNETCNSEYLPFAADAYQDPASTSTTKVSDYVGGVMILVGILPWIFGNYSSHDSQPCRKRSSISLCFIGSGCEASAFLWCLMQQALRSVEQYLNLDKLYVLGANCEFTDGIVTEFYQETSDRNITNRIVTYFLSEFLTEFQQIRISDQESQTDVFRHKPVGNHYY